MNFYDTRNSYLKLNEEISKIKTQADFNSVENHIKENLIYLSKRDINKLVESFNKKGNKLDVKELLQLKEAIEIEEDDFDLLADNDEEYVDVDDEENFIDDEDEDTGVEYKKIKITNIEPYYTLEDIDPLAASELDMYPDEYLAQCKEYIRQYFKDDLGDPFYLDVPVDYLESEGELEDFIEETISDLTGYLVDNYDYEVVDDIKEPTEEQSVEEIKTEEVQEPIEECGNKPKSRYEIKAINEDIESEVQITEDNKSTIKNNVRKVAKALMDMGYRDIKNRFIDPSARGYRVKNWKPDEGELEEIEKLSGVKCTTNINGDLVIPYSYDDTEVWDEEIFNEDNIKLINEIQDKIIDYCEQNNIKYDLRKTSNRYFRLYKKITIDDRLYIWFGVHGDDYKDDFNFWLGDSPYNSGNPLWECSLDDIKNKGLDNIIKELFNVIEKDSKEGENK